MYMLPISVMVAMVIMRGTVIVIGRLVDAIQIRQGLLKKRVYKEENWAVVFAIVAVGINVLLLPLVDLLEQHGVSVNSWFGIKPEDSKGAFDFIHSKAAVIILGSYIVAYAFRIYIMNYYKNTRPKGMKLDNNGFFAIEQIAATATMLLVGYILFKSTDWFENVSPQIVLFHNSFADPRPLWGWAVVAGFAYGLVAFFSVFIFMFKGRTATFAGLVNRLTSLVAGTTATLVLYFAFQGKFPKGQDWLSLVFILIAVWFLSRAEKKRTRELVATREIETIISTKTA